jgi:hypothetical protein
MRSPVLVMVLFTACGRGAPFDDDAVPAQMQNPSPVVSCRTTCSTVPPTLETPFTLSNGVPLHWLTCGGCLRVTIDQDLPSASRSLVALMVKNWIAALQGPNPTAGLCFVIDERPTVGDVMAPRRIHLRALAANTYPPGVTQMTTSRFHQASGELISAEVEVSGADPLRELTYGFGQALGLGTSTDRARSVMISSRGVLDAPGPADEVSLRAMYGPPAWCNP